MKICGSLKIIHGASNKKKGVSNENMWVSNEVIESPNENMGSPMKICESLMKIWGPHARIWGSPTKFDISPLGSPIEFAVLDYFHATITLKIYSILSSTTIHCRSINPFKLLINVLRHR